MQGEILLELFIFTLAAFLGLELIAKVPATLHTPLMSGSNAVSGIVLVASILVLGKVDNPVLQFVAFLSIVLASINVFGGFAVTDRMLQMFRKKPAARAAGSEKA
ncbi:MAG: NAD(P) transhydrogenase subunit alpha [Chloroflexota bacterium]